MLDFSLSAEQVEIRQLARSIAIEHLRPQGRAAEQSGALTPILSHSLVQTGLTMPFPEQYGGSGSLEATTYVVIAEELGFGDGGLAMHILGSLMGPLAIAIAGTESQRAQYLPRFCAGEAVFSQRGSLGFAERSGGYFVSDIQATIQPDSQVYLINGNKRDVIHGARSTPRIILLRQTEMNQNAGLCAVVLPEMLEGLLINEDQQKLGLLAAPSASYQFQQVSIPANALLGVPGTTDALRIAILYSLLRAGVACGTVRAALEYAGQYAQERIAFGRPILSYQSIAFMLAEMAMKLDAVRLLLWQAAFNWDCVTEPEILLREAEAAQQQALKLAQSSTADAIQIMGGAGFMQDHPVEMWMRNAATME